MLVASDRSNFSGPYFMAQWIYPLLLGPQSFAQAFAVVGPKEGPSGRNDGATVSGAGQQVGYKYHGGVYNELYAPAKATDRRAYASGPWPPAAGAKLLTMGRGALAGGQRQSHCSVLAAITRRRWILSIVPCPTVCADYGLFNAVAFLFDKDLLASGRHHRSGAFCYGYVDDGERAESLRDMDCVSGLRVSRNEVSFACCNRSCVLTAIAAGGCSGDGGGGRCHSNDDLRSDR